MPHSKEKTANERRVKTPNTSTHKAIKELEADNGEQFANVCSLLADLNTDD